MGNGYTSVVVVDGNVDGVPVDGKAYPCFPKDSPGAKLVVRVPEWDKSNATFPPEVSLVEILHMPFPQLKLGRVFKLG